MTRPRSQKAKNRSFPKTNIEIPMTKCKPPKKSKTIVEMDYSYLVEFDKEDIKEDVEIIDNSEILSTKKRHKAFWIFTVICIILTPILIIQQIKQRGYFAFGGEFVVPLLPLLVYLFRDTFKDLAEIFTIQKEDD